LGVSENGTRQSPFSRTADLGDEEDDE
jgi:hypothetical protein